MDKTVQYAFQEGNTVEQPVPAEKGYRMCTLVRRTQYTVPAPVQQKSRALPVPSSLRSREDSCPNNNNVSPPGEKQPSKTTANLLSH